MVKLIIKYQAHLIFIFVFFPFGFPVRGLFFIEDLISWAKFSFYFFN